jgi:hypothetical protein
MFLLCDSLHSLQSNWVLILNAEIETRNVITVLQDGKETTKHLLKEGLLDILAGFETRYGYCGVVGTSNKEISQQAHSNSLKLCKAK